RQPRHRELSRHLLAALLGAHVDDDTLETGLIPRGHWPEHGRVRLTVLSPRGARPRLAGRRLTGPRLVALARHRQLARRERLGMPLGGERERGPRGEIGRR